VAPSPDGDLTIFDQESQLYEWFGGQFVPYQGLSQENTPAEDECRFNEQCDCTDTDIQDTNFFGSCYTYAPGGVNHGFCQLDDVCDACRISCAAECFPSCLDASQDLFDARQSYAWNQKVGLRGAADFTHFQVGDEHFLAVAQSVCDHTESREECISSGRVQPQSALLQWDGEKFGPLLAEPPNSVPEAIKLVHSSAIRIPFGAMSQIKMFDLPRSDNSTMSVLFGFSQTRGIAHYEWTFQTVSGLKGLVDMALSDNGKYLYTLAEIDSSLTVFERTAVLDILGNVIGNLRYDSTWFRGEDWEDSIDGARELSIESAPGAESFVPLSVVVNRGLLSNELICGAPPLLGQLLPWQLSTYQTNCQQLSFDVVQVEGNQNLFQTVPSISRDGTLSFELMPGASGTAVFRVETIDDGPMNNRSEAQTFAIHVVCSNAAPSFTTQDVMLSEDSSEVVLPFAGNISAGSPAEASQQLRWEFTFTNPSLFSQTPRLDIVNDEGLVALKPAPNMYGRSLISAILIDDGGTCSELSDGAASSRDFRTPEASSVERFFSVTVAPRNDAPQFQFNSSRIVMFADEGVRSLSQWATRISAGPHPNENYQQLTFTLISVDMASGVYSEAEFFDQRPALSPRGELTFATAPKANGVLQLTFTLADDGGGPFNSTTKAFILAVLPVNQAPVFSLPQNVVFLSTTSGGMPQTFSGFVTDISAGARDEDANQRISLQVINVSNPELFSELPRLSADGTLRFTPLSSPGSSTVLALLSDDGGKNSREPTGEDRVTLSFTIVFSLPEAQSSFQLTRDEIHVAEDAGMIEIPGFASNIIRGFRDGPDDAPFFNVSFLTTSEDLFSVLPYITDDGTLRFMSGLDKFGSAISSASVNASNFAPSTANTQHFTIFIHPQPRVESVSPALVAARGGSVITVQGHYFGAFFSERHDLTCASASLSVMIGNRACANLNRLSDTTIVCTASEGLGSQTAEVEVREGDVTRSGVLPGALYQSALAWGGVTSSVTGGFFAIGPRSDYLGNVSFPAASAGVIGETQPMADRGVNAIAMYKHKTYVGGKLSRFGGVLVFGIAAFNGRTVEPLGSGVDGTVYTIKQYGDVLVVGGGFTKVFQPLVAGVDAANGGMLSTGGLAAWDGNEWGLVGGSAVFGVVTTSLVNGTRLFIAGRFSDEDRRNNLALYDGEAWRSICGVNGVCGVTGGIVNAMDYWNDDLYVGGSFTAAGGVRAARLARWDGFQWYAMGEFDGDVLALITMDDQLLVGGEFASVDGVQAVSIARFRNGVWDSVGGGLGGPVYTMASLDSCLYVGGSFTSAGGLESISEVPIRHAVRRCMGRFSSANWEPVDWGGDVDPGIVSAVTVM